MKYGELVLIRSRSGFYFLCNDPRSTTLPTSVHFMLEISFKIYLHLFQNMHMVNKETLVGYVCQIGTV